MEDGREIFDDDLDDDVVENNKGNQLCSIALQQFICIMSLGQCTKSDFWLCLQEKQALKEQTQRKT